MSAFYSFVYGDCVQVLTDRAIYDAEGTLQGFGEKVWRSDSLPIAITGRGNVGVLATMLKECCLFDGCDSVDSFLAAVSTVLQNPIWSMVATAELFIACISESRGPEHHFFSNEEGQPIVKGKVDAAQFGCGPTISMADLPEAANDWATVQSSDFPDRFGADILGAMRRVGARTAQGQVYHCVGGGVDLTTVNASGTATKKLVEWPDKIGEKIDPNAVGILA